MWPGSSSGSKFAVAMAAKLVVVPEVELDVADAYARAGETAGPTKQPSRSQRCTD